jgi:hypothetical protein
MNSSNTIQCLISSRIYLSRTGKVSVCEELLHRVFIFFSRSAVEDEDVRWRRQMVEFSVIRSGLSYVICQKISVCIREIRVLSSVFTSCITITVYRYNIT